MIKGFFLLFGEKKEKRGVGGVKIKKVCVLFLGVILKNSK